MKTRVLTVSSIMPATHRNNETPLPFIRLIGRWVQEAGFLPGDTITVEVEYCRLTVTKKNSDGSVPEPIGDPNEFAFVREVDNRKEL